MENDRGIRTICSDHFQKVLIGKLVNPAESRFTVTFIVVIVVGVKNRAQLKFPIFGNDFLNLFSECFSKDGHFPGLHISPSKTSQNNTFN